jgi:O-acetyl-ADP-ribose deacetylase
MAAPIEIDAWRGSLSELEVDALVVSATETLFMTAGAAAAVKRHGGDEIERAAVEQGPVPLGSAVVTHAGSLAVGHGRVADPERLTAAIRAALDLAEPLQLHRIAISLIGVEFGVFRVEEAARLLVDTIRTSDAPIDSVVIATAQAHEDEAVRAALAAGAAAP